MSAAAPLAIGPMAEAEIAEVVALWERCGLIRPWNDPRADIALARQGPNATILVGHHDGRIAAAVMVGHDGHRGWFYYLGVDPDARGIGFGRAITAAAEDWLRQRGIMKAQLMVRADNKDVEAFYRSLGYGEQQRIVFGKWLDGRPPTP